MGEIIIWRHYRRWRTQEKRPSWSHLPRCGHGVVTMGCSHGDYNLFPGPCLSVLNPCLCFSASERWAGLLHHALLPWCLPQKARGPTNHGLKALKLGAKINLSSLQLFFSDHSNRKITGRQYLKKIWDGLVELTKNMQITNLLDLSSKCITNK